MSADEATLAKKPHYNGYICGHGAHGDAKYSRTKSKRAWQKQLKQEGAPRGSFLFYLLRSFALQKAKEPSARKDHTVAEAPAAGKGRCPIRPERVEGMQKLDMHLQQKAPCAARKRELAYS